MPRYWVNLGDWGEWPDTDTEEEMKQLQIREKLDKLRDVRTTDLEEARECRRKAIEIIERHGYSAEFVYISTQPECPNCRHQGRFSDFYCARCGTELIPSEAVE